MKRTRAHLVTILGLGLCVLATAPTAGASKRGPKPKPRLPYTIGAYSGTLTQLQPYRITAPIRFLVSGGALSALNVEVAELCDKTIWSAVTDAPKALHVPISGDGSFAYDKTVLGDHLQLRGRVRGNQATGTLSDALKVGSFACTMSQPAPFAAKH